MEIKFTESVITNKCTGEAGFTAVPSLKIKRFKTPQESKGVLNIECFNLVFLSNKRTMILKFIHLHQSHYLGHSHAGSSYYSMNTRQIWTLAGKPVRQSFTSLKWACLFCLPQWIPGSREGNPYRQLDNTWYSTQTGTRAQDWAWDPGAVK